MPEELDQMTLEDLDKMVLAGESDSKPEKSGKSTAARPDANAILAGLKKKAEENRQVGDIYPSWDPINQGKGAKVIGVLLDKRKVVKDREMPLFVVDTQVPVRATGRDENGHDQEWDAYKGPVTVWCGTILAKQWDKAEVNRLTYIEFLGVAKGQSGRKYNDFAFSQATKEELLAWSSATK